MSANQYWNPDGNQPGSNQSDHQQRQYGESYPQQAYNTQQTGVPQQGYYGNPPYQQSTYQYSETHYQAPDYASNGRYDQHAAQWPAQNYSNDSYGNAAPPPPVYGQNGPNVQDPYGYSQPRYEQPGFHAPPNQFPPYQPPGNGPPEPSDDKGLLGAIGGAAAGGFAGHKVHHGFLGAIGGAFAGHKLEDAMKDKKKNKKGKHHGHDRRDSSSSSSSSDSDSSKHRRKQSHSTAIAPAEQHHNAAFVGNFSASCSDITLDRDYDLIARCYGRDGQQRLSSIKLNDCLTNSWGELRWAKGGNFGPSARNVRLVDGGRVLEAEAGDGNGGWRRNLVRLDERISNENGELIFLH